MWPADWSAVLLPEAPIAELFSRATVIYFFLYAMLLVAGRRLFGQLAMSDMLVAPRPRGDGARWHNGAVPDVGDAVVSAVTVVGWNFLIDVAARRWTLMRTVLRHGPVLIIDDGRLLAENARRNLLTRPEIMETLREHGMSRISDLREARLEADGSVSVSRR